MFLSRPQALPDRSRFAISYLALLLGHWLNGEAILPKVWLGTGLILGGLVMHQWRLVGIRANTGVSD